jgi:hypothetical protein
MKAEELRRSPLSLSPLGWAATTPEPAVASIRAHDPRFGARSRVAARPPGGRFAFARWNRPHNQSVTVLRNGRVSLQSDDLATISRTELVTAMVGWDVVASGRPHDAAVPADAPVLLDLREVGTVFGHWDVTFSVAAGEVFGFYSIVGRVGPDRAC